MLARVSKQGENSMSFLRFQTSNTDFIRSVYNRVNSVEICAKKLVESLANLINIVRIH